MISEHHIPIQKSARYYIDRPTQVKQVLFVIHGYRQLAGRFIKRFSALTEDGVMVIAPEGLHRFYIEGYSGNVGASWMTKEDRLTDIEDYVRYLNQLIEALDLPDVPLSLLGFSQGGPTACRWLARCTHTFDHLILHSTVFPNDFDFDAQRSRLATTRSYAIFGDDDMFASEDTIQKKMSWMKANGVSPELLRFKGGHEIHIESIQRILRK